MHRFRTDVLTEADLAEPIIQGYFAGKRKDIVENELNDEWVKGVHIDRVEELQSMTALAIQYYLPCFLKWVLRHQDDFATTIAMIHFLNIDDRKRFGVDWPKFTSEQKLAILAWIDFLREHIKSYDLDPYEKEYRGKLRELRTQWNSA